jgi:hypothetical protein
MPGGPGADDDVLAGFPPGEAALNSLRPAAAPPPLDQHVPLHVPPTRPPQAGLAHGFASASPFAIRFATWNCRGLVPSLTGDPHLHQAGMRYLRELMHRADIIGLQEVHGTASMMHEIFKAMPGWLHYVSASSSPAAGGVALLVNRVIVDRARSVVPQVLLQGRGTSSLQLLEHSSRPSSRMPSLPPTASRMPPSFLLTLTRASLETTVFGYLIFMRLQVTMLLVHGFLPSSPASPSLSMTVLLVLAAVTELRTSSAALTTS